MPRLADTLVEGTVARWLKRPGDRLQKGEPLVEIETDKVSSTLESPVEGVLTEVVAGPGATVDVGALIARIAEDSEAVQTAAVVEVSGEAPPSGQPGLTLMRRRIAERMQESRARVAQGACVREIELDSSWKEQNISPTAVFVKALAAATGFGQIGVAVEIPGGLVVPVIRDADDLSLDGISSRVRELASKAREGKLLPDEVMGAQFTVTNVGATGTLMAFPLVPAGQPGILAPGAIRDDRCYLTLCYDRAAMDDFEADRLLAKIANDLHGAR